MPITYVLYSQKTKKFYTGSSHQETVQNRLVEHNAGRVKSTKFGRPWNLVFSEYYDSYTQARQRELFLKTGVGRKELQVKFGSIKNTERYPSG